MMRRPLILSFRLLGVSLAVLVLTVMTAGCNQFSLSQPTTEPGARIELVAEGFVNPLWLTQPPGESDRLFVLEQRLAAVRIIKDGSVVEEPFLAIPDLVGSTENEQGLLGMAFHPDYQKNGYFFLNYTNKDGNTEVVRYRVSDDPDKADATSRKLLLSIEQPWGNHNGGMIAFGPDGYLYIGMGDGGAGGDPQNNAQKPDTLLGKMLRIDVNVPDDSDKPYAIPEDNPFVGSSHIRDEIWHFGLRNPWRFSFDRKTGDLYFGDVGQHKWEEVSFQSAGRGGMNFGWRFKEGFNCFKPSRDCDREDLTDPIYEYGRDVGMCITGGYVYRGSKNPDLEGLYIFGDYVTSRILSLRVKNGRVIETDDLTQKLLNDDGEKLGLVASFGEDNAGELYIIDWMGGRIYTIVPGPEQAS